MDGCTADGCEIRFSHCSEGLASDDAPVHAKLTRFQSGANGLRPSTGGLCAQVKQIHRGEA